MQKVVQIWRSSNRAKILIIVGLLVLLCACCGIVVLLFPSSSDDAAVTDSVEVQVSETATVTHTAEAMDTPVPTSTIKPEELADEDDADVVYRQAIIDISDLYAKAFFQFADLTGAASEDESLLDDEDWVTDMAVTLAVIRALNDDIRALDPPGRFNEAHSHLLDAAVHYDAFVDLFVEGLEDLNTDLLNEASEEILSGNEALNRASEAIAELQ